MRSKTLVLLLFAAQLSLGLQAQTYALKGINSFSSNGIKAILNNKGSSLLRPVLQNRQSRLQK
ncbi:MAG: hypothetical protein IPK76_01315 [Lewinellaceae bacterium]|nr:hypothetical protein [Lewinellaceae bacterium]